MGHGDFIHSFNLLAGKHNPVSMSALNENIRKFYDQSSPLWLDMWGEHMHHGYYGPDGNQKKDHYQAQIDLIEELLSWGAVNQPANILDVGCGVGGSARYLAVKYQAEVLGLTLSPVQARRAAQYNQKSNLEGQVEVIVQDILSYEAPEHPYDLIYSMESAEHIPDKQRLLQLFYQLLKPGGQFVMATWCHRNTADQPLSKAEKQQLEKICKVYHLPPMISIQEYQQLAASSGFKHISTDDWSAAVAPFWKAVIASALSWRGIRGLFRAGLGTMQGAWAMRYMQSGFQSGLIRFGLIKGTK
jgi:tocopherol O-methyltransferase